MRVRRIESGWRFWARNDQPDYHQPQVRRLGPLSANVPGSVHLDLMRHGVVADPFRRMQERSCAWVDELDWSYETEFEWHASPELPRRVLRFNGLDAIVTVFLNGEKVASHDNMFVPLEVDVTDRLEEGRNLLRLDFESAERVGRQRRKVYFEKEGLPWSTVWFDERAFVRKPAYMYGWDWGPRIVGCGIWRSVELLEFLGRITQVSFLQERLSTGQFRVRAETEVEGEGKLWLSFGDQEREPGQEPEFTVEPTLWWPNGEGRQYMYDAHAALDTGHRIGKRIGLRTMRLLRERDEFGRSFEFEVNGRRIWSRGANWIPNDSFPSRIHADQTDEQLFKYKRLGFNMLRVWGGGFYESEEFYDACDRLGIMVWQDFPYACSYYPDSPEYLEASADEARQQVGRLRDRTSLALWCGNSENHVLWEGKWGGQEHSPPRYYGEHIYTKALAQVVQELDPSRPYIDSSPVNAPPEQEDGSRAESWGDVHYWDAWHGRGDWIHYEESKGRFSSELGFASAGSLPMWRSVLDHKEMHADSEALWWHDKTGKGSESFRGFVELHYPRARSLEEWVYYSQLNQRNAMRFAIEHYRRSEFCRGALIWQANDCWPAQSWSLEDYRRLLKPAGHELMRLFAPSLICMAHDKGILEVWVCHDGHEELDAILAVEATHLRSGEKLDRDCIPLTMQPGERRCIRKISTERFDLRRTAFRAYFENVPGSSRWCLLCEPKEAETYPELEGVEMEGRLHVAVKGVAFDLVVWDPDNPGSVLNPTTLIAGWAPLTVANKRVEYRLLAPTKRVIARSLAGSVELNLTIHRV